MTDTTMPIELEVTVAAPVEDAFRVFTGEIGTWWPVDVHSIGEEKVTAVLMEGGAGGRLYEVWDNGEQRDWADVLEWDEPHRIVLAWHPNPDRSTSTEIEIRFTSEGDGTRVSLEHRGWDRLGAEAAEARESYLTGWPPVIDLFTRQVDARGVPR